MSETYDADRNAREGYELAIAEMRKRHELDNYDPEKGLKTIAVAEAAEKYYARAKDIAKLYEAIEMKLGEQRRFIVWFDEVFHEGKPKPGGNRQVADLKLEGIPEKTTRHRWRTRLKDPKKFDTTVQTTQERARRTCEFEKGATEQRGASGGQEIVEWYTPANHLTVARDVLGAIDLDPASSDAAQKRVQAEHYFTKETNGLGQEWHGRVWLNPPYMQPDIAEFVSKMVAECRAGRVIAGIMLTHNYTDTAWFHEAMTMADAVCFTRGRIKFERSDGLVAAPTQGQAFFYFGSDIETFAVRFRDIGFIVVPYHGEVSGA